MKFIKAILFSLVILCFCSFKEAIRTNAMIPTLHISLPENKTVSEEDPLAGVESVDELGSREYGYERYVQEDSDPDVHLWLQGSIQKNDPYGNLCYYIYDTYNPNNLCRRYFVIYNCKTGSIVWYDVIP